MDAKLGVGHRPSANVMKLLRILIAEAISFPYPHTQETNADTIITVQTISIQNNKLSRSSRGRE